MAAALKSSQQFQLACNSNFTTNFLTSLTQLQSWEMFTDFTIKVQEQQIPCHKVILASHSAYFKVMFRSGMKETRDDEVCLHHLDGQVLSSIIHYFYTGKIEIGRNQIKDAVEVCEYLQITILKSNLADHINSLLTSDNCISWARFADIYNLKFVLAKAEKLKCRMFNVVTRGEEFLSLTQKEVQNFIDDAKTEGAHSDDLMKACMRWLQWDPKTRMSSFLQFLPHVKLESCSFKYLNALSAEHDTFPSDDGKAYKLISASILAAVKAKINGSEQKRLLVIGGVTGLNDPNPQGWSVDLENGRTAPDWESFVEIPENTNTAYGTCCKIKNGIVFLGGQKRCRSSTECGFFNLKTKKWSPLPPLPNATWGLASTCVEDSVYIFGGNTCPDSVNHLNMNTQEWHADAPMLEDQMWPIVCSKGSDIYVVYNMINGLKHSSSLQHYDTSSGVWTFKASLPQGVNTNHASSLICRERLYLTGGNSANCLCYDIAVDSWSVLRGPSLDHQHGAAVACRDKIYLCGGGMYSTDIEEYDIENDAWKVSHLKLPAGLCCHTAAWVE